MISEIRGGRLQLVHLASEGQETCHEAICSSRSNEASRGKKKNQGFPRETGGNQKDHT